MVVIPVRKEKLSFSRSYVFHIFNIGKCFICYLRWLINSKMNTGVIAILVTILVAFLTLITYIAFGYVDFYQKYYWKILTTIIILFAIISAYDLGIQILHISLIRNMNDFIDSKDSSNIFDLFENSVKSVSINYIIVVGTYFVTSGYIIFMGWLPDFIKENKNKS